MLDTQVLKKKLTRCAQLYSLTKDGLWMKWLFEADAAYTV